MSFIQRILVLLEKLIFSVFLVFWTHDDDHMKHASLEEVAVRERPAVF